MENSSNDNAWNNVRKIWSCCDVKLPEQIDNDHAHYLFDLKIIAALVVTADEVNRVDRSRKTKPKDIANLCRTLTAALAQLDVPTLARMASASAMDYRQILNETVANLYFLETIFDRTNEPSLPWKTKHELNDMAVIRLAEVFEGRTNSSPSVTRHWERADRTGQFVDFVLKFYEHMLPDFASTVSGRSIQASLEKRALWSQD